MIRVHVLAVACVAVLFWGETAQGGLLKWHWVEDDEQVVKRGTCAPVGEAGSPIIETLTGNWNANNIRKLGVVVITGHTVGPSGIAAATSPAQSPQFKNKADLTPGNDQSAQNAAPDDETFFRTQDIPIWADDHILGNVLQYDGIRTSSPIVSFQIEGIYDINLHAGTRTKIQNNEIWCYARVIKGATQDTSKQTLIQEPSDTSNNNAYIITFGEANKEVSILTPQQLIDVRQDPNSTAGPQHVTFHCGRPSADDKNAASSQAQDASKPKGQASNKVQGSTGRVQLVSSNSISDSTAGITPSSTTSTPSGTTAGTSDGTFQGQPVVKSRRLRRRSLNKRESL